MQAPLRRGLAPIWWRLRRPSAGGSTVSVFNITGSGGGIGSGSAFVSSSVNSTPGAGHPRLAPAYPRRLGY